MTMRDIDGSFHPAPARERAGRHRSALPAAAALAGAAAGALAVTWLTHWALSHPAAGAGPEGAPQPAEGREPRGPVAEPVGAQAQAAAATADADGPRALLRQLRAAEAAVFEALGLSPHERCIGRHVMRGLTYREIGARIYLAERTVKYHAQRIYAKARVENRRAFEAYVRDAVDHAARGGA